MQGQAPGPGAASRPWSGTVVNEERGTKLSIQSVLSESSPRVVMTIGHFENPNGGGTYFPYLAK